jgi:hypothetical protein
MQITVDRGVLGNNYKVILPRVVSTVLRSEGGSMKISTPQLDQAVASFVRFVQSLPPEKLQPSKSEKWGPLEVFIHLVFWHEQYARIATATLAGKKREMLHGTFKEINGWAVAQNLALPVPELIRRWKRAQAAIVHLTQAPSAERLKFSLREGSKEWPLPVLIRLAAGHITNHESKLRKTVGLTRQRRSAALV